MQFLWLNSTFLSTILILRKINLVISRTVLSYEKWQSIKGENADRIHCILARASCSKCLNFRWLRLINILTSRMGRELIFRLRNFSLKIAFSKSSTVTLCCIYPPRASPRQRSGYYPRSAPDAVRPLESAAYL